MVLIYQVQRRIPKSVPWVLEIHKSLVKDWFWDYSVKDFLADGDICNNPHKYDEIKWANKISSYFYNVYPLDISRLNGRYLTNYYYFQDDEKTGKMVLRHFEEFTAPQ